MAEFSFEQQELIKEKYGIEPNGLYFPIQIGEFVWIGELKPKSMIFYDKHFREKPFYISHMTNADRLYTLEEAINYGWIEPVRFAKMDIQDKKSVIEIMCRKRGPSATLDFITGGLHLRYTDDEVITLFSTEEFSTETEEMLKAVRPWENERDGYVIANGMYFPSKLGHFIWAGSITKTSEVSIFYEKHYSYNAFRTSDVQKTDKLYTLDEVVENGWITNDRFKHMWVGERRAVIEVMRRKKGPSATLNFITGGGRYLGYTDEKVIAIFGAK
jgi:hypothetical protein